MCLLDLLKYGLTDAGRADSMLLDKFVDLITTNKINPNLVVPAPDYTGINALMLVSIRDHENGKAVESLVKLGADMYATDTRGWTSLMYASSAGNLDAASKLLSLSNFDMKLMTYVSNDGETALTLARKKKAVKVVALLEKHMPHVEHTALKNTQDTDSSLKRIKASPVQKGKYAVELVDAILKQNPSKVKEYLADGADYEFVGKGGYTPLLQAAAKGNVEIIKMLVDLGANVNAAENDGWISIMFPAFQGRLDVLDTLLDAGAEALTPNKFGKYAFDLALSNGHKKVAARIATEAMPAAIRKEDSSMIKRLLAAGGNPAAVDVSGGGRTPLMVLTRSNLLSAEDVEKFLNDYGTVDVNSADANGNTALFYAVDKGDVSIVAVLIAHGADTKHRNRAGKTVVEIAQSKSQTDVVNLLDRFPDAKAMQNALASLRNAQNNQGHSIQEAAFALSNPKIDATYLEQTAESTVDVDPVQEASALRYA